MREIQVKRYHLSIVAKQTQKMLVMLVVFCGITLFLVQLFLLNHLTSSSYLLSQESEKSYNLSQTLEQIDSAIARIQTQEFVTKKSDKKNHMIVKTQQSFVYVPFRMTAKKQENRKEF